MGFQSKGKTIETLQEAVDQGMRYLQVRSLSTYELRQKLKLKGVSDEWCDEVESKIYSWGYLDDGALANDYCRLLMESRKYSLRMIQQKLKMRGLTPPSFLKNYDEIAIAFRLVEGKFSFNEEMKFEEDHKIPRKKLVSFLANRGFSFSTISLISEEYGDYLRWD